MSIIGFDYYFDMDTFSMVATKGYDTNTKKIIVNGRQSPFTFENVLGLGGNPIQYATMETAREVAATFKSSFPNVPFTLEATKPERVGIMVPQWHILVNQPNGFSLMFIAGTIAMDIFLNGVTNAMSVIRVDLHNAGLA